MSSFPLVASGSGRHRKPKETNPSLRRALVVAATAPIAATILTAPSAFAADEPGSTENVSSRPILPSDETTTETTEGKPKFVKSVRPGTGGTTGGGNAGTGLSPVDQEIADALDARIGDPRLGSNLSGVVLDAESDKVIWGHNATTALMPASNAKLATATAALTAFRPDYKFNTDVIHDDGTLYLIGGGDPMLSSEEIGRMAENTAELLKRAGRTSVELRIDDTLFAEPTLATGWRADYYPNEVTPVRSLAVDGHTVTDTALDAGEVFAGFLADQGITVTGDITREKVKGSGSFMVREYSETVSEIVKSMLKKSDNNTAETLLRMTALATGRPATFEGGTEAVRDLLSSRYGVSMENFEMYDGSGLSRSTRIPAQTLADILDLTTDPRYSDTLKPIADGLPVAGEEGGTLGPEWGRFDTPDSQCAVGEVKGKTGTLTGAVALSGLTQGEDGRWKVFSFVENGSTAANDDIKDAMDGLAASVNGCNT